MGARYGSGAATGLVEARGPESDQWHDAMQFPPSLRGCSELGQGRAAGLRAGYYQVTDQNTCLGTFHLILFPLAPLSPF